MSGSNTKRQKSKVLLRLIKYVHWLLSVAIFVLFWFAVRYSRIPEQFEKTMRYDLYIVLLYSGLLLWFNATFNSYDLGYFKIRHLILSQCLTDFFSVAIIYAVVSLAWLKLINPLYFILIIIIQTILNLAWSIFANRLYYKLVRKLKAVVVYGNENDLTRLMNISGKPIERTISIEEYIQCDDTDLSGIESEISGYDEVFGIGINDTLMNSLCKYCVANDVGWLFVPHIGDVIMSGAEHIKSFSYPVLSVRRADKTLEYLFIKRAFDIIASVCGIVLLSPLMLFVAAWIKAYDGGPVIYKQVRLTKDAKQFNIYKFRSMLVDAEKDGVARLSSGENDNRITPVGKILRACRFDELPQLFNILKGDMTLVGPRPERPEIAAEYEKTLPEFALRLQVKAGLTGYAQIYGKYNTPPYEKLMFDLMYINKMSVITDIELIFETIRIVFNRESTEGVAGSIDINHDSTPAEDALSVR